MRTKANSLKISFRSKVNGRAAGQRKNKKIFSQSSQHPYIISPILKPIISEYQNLKEKKNLLRQSLCNGKKSTRKKNTNYVGVVQVQNDFSLFLFTSKSNKPLCTHNIEHFIEYCAKEMPHRHSQSVCSAFGILCERTDSE